MPHFEQFWDPSSIGIFRGPAKSRARLDRLKDVKKRLEEAKDQLEIAQREGGYELASLFASTSQNDSAVTLSVLIMSHKLKHFIITISSKKWSWHRMCQWILSEKYSNISPLL
ncbi:hypothetical protein M378DRAFT_14647 [Amanita muscaria Koide BX008]|uniref:Uncharacterized protein n=1 Tax=Amanita muscaria (strain Koide BX008) TaxID=946122 RepID=A0A0C2SZW6_AMAMK|nr:hypothetical protein M378DRAFT_14647 [Amanita muscaria Koide BX008]